MKKVEIYALQENGGQKTIAECFLSNNNMVQCRGEDWIIAKLNNGIENPKTRKKIFPKDGIMFLKNLKYHYKSGYLMASGILEN